MWKGNNNQILKYRNHHLLHSFCVKLLPFHNQPIIHSVLIINRPLIVRDKLSLQISRSCCQQWVRSHWAEYFWVLILHPGTCQMWWTGRLPARIRTYLKLAHSFSYRGEGKRKVILNIIGLIKAQLEWFCWSTRMYYLTNFNSKRWLHSISCYVHTKFEIVCCTT